MSDLNGTGLWTHNISCRRLSHACLVLVIFWSLALLAACGESRDSEALNLDTTDSSGWVFLDTEQKSTVIATPLATTVLESVIGGQIDGGEAALAAVDVTPTVTLIPGFNASSFDQVVAPSSNLGGAKDRNGDEDSGSGNKIDGDTPEQAEMTGATADPNVTPQPTPTLSAANAPRFPESVVETFTVSAFITSLEETQKTFREFDLNYMPILREERDRNRGDCGAFVGWYRQWRQAPVFEDVPQDWVSLYFEYRTLLSSASFNTGFLRRQCPELRTQEDSRTYAGADPLAFFGWAYPRLQAMVQEAYVLR